MDQLVGQTLNRYQLNTLLGEGGMGAVYKAKDLTLERDVAIKILHPHFARQPNFRERFLQEARTAAKLDHPSIVKVYDFGQANNLLYIVMEFIPGSNLEKILTNLRKANQGIKLEEVLKMMISVCDALDYAHRQGVLHRDIKPGNIMIKPEPIEGLPYRPVLTDLGLAKLLEGVALTQEGTVMGTPAYMSPEAALGQPTDRRSDVYSMGILLYELSVGRLPFPVKSLTEAVRYHTKEPPPPPTTIRPDLAPELERVILKSLEKDPEVRYKSTAEFGKAMEELLPQVAATSTAVAETAVNKATTVDTQGVSLVTQYQASSEPERGPSILNEFAASGPSNQDRIQVMSKENTGKIYTMKPGGLVIGRDKAADIPLDDTKVSRRHARIDFDGTTYRIVDLNSTNGSFLLDVKLLPGVPEVWAPDKPLRVGETWIRLVKAGTGDVRTSTDRGRGTAVAPVDVNLSRGSGGLGVAMPNSQLSVEPGGSVTFSLVLLNQGAVVEHFKIFVIGIPETWIPSPLPTVQLMPGDQKELSFNVAPPKESASRAGRYPVTIRVVSQNTPDHFGEAKATLTVGMYSRFTTELYPKKIRSGQTAGVTIRNMGNMAELFQVKFLDDAAELNFEATQPQLQVPEGQSVRLGFRADLKTRRFFGLNQTHRYNAQVISPRGEVQTLPGEVVSIPLIPAWVLPIVAFLCLVTFSVAAILWSNAQARIAQATQTENALQTELALDEVSRQATESALMTATQLSDLSARSTESAIQTATAQILFANQTATQQAFNSNQTATAGVNYANQTATQAAFSINQTATALANKELAQTNAAKTSLAQTQTSQARTLTAMVPTITRTPTRTPTRTATPTPRVAFSLTDRFCDAQWGNGTVLTLPCPGAVNDNRGFIVRLTNVRLQNNVIYPGFSLETHPQWIDNGYIQGKYPAFNLKYGDRFKAKVGCLYGGPACDVVMEIYVLNSGSTTKVYETRVFYGGIVQDVDIPLNFNGPSNFTLRTRANGSAGQDWAVWVNPHVERIGP
jgi:serine/threonine protein kinase